MDSLTHIVLGGVVGEAIAGKKLGKKALFIGAAAQSLPDIDFIASFWLNPANDLLAHRGFTHSFLFIALTAPALALVFDKFLPSALRWQKWSLLFAVEMLIHIFLDAFNAYGVAWFEPFSHVRISFNALFVADPFFSVPIAAVFVFLLIAAINHPRRIRVALFAIGWCALYLGYGLLNKMSVDTRVQESIVTQRIPATQYFSTPTALNNWLWYIVVNTDQGSYVGYRSVFDPDVPIDYEFFERNEHLIESVPSLRQAQDKLRAAGTDEDIQSLKRFSEGYYTIESWGDTLVFNDLRFGQVLGWRERRGRFVFHYYLSHPLDNYLVIQRGRFTGWNLDTGWSLIRRIAGQGPPDERKK